MATRAGRGDDLEVRAEKIREQLRARETTGERVFASALAGDEASALALGLDAPQLALLEALGGYGRSPKNTKQAEAALRAYYSAMGYTQDRYGALVGGDKRIVFKDRNVEICRGRPGAWTKCESGSKLKKAEELAAKANGRLADLRGRREKEKKASAKRSVKRALKKNVLRAAAVFSSIDLTPEERFESLSGDLDEDFLANAQAYLPEIERTLDPDATPAQIDAALSVDTPPVFVFDEDTKKGEEWPESHKWKDATTGLPIELRRDRGGRSIAVMIGNVPVDPLTGGVDALRFAATVAQGSPPSDTSIVACGVCGRKNRVDPRPSVRAVCGACRAPLPVIVQCADCGQKNRVDPSRIDDYPICGACGEPLDLDDDTPGRTPKSGYTGVAGVIRVTPEGAEPQLYYIESAERREGVARRMIRLFCRIAAAYGFTSFAALGVGSLGRALLQGLEAEDEIQILGWQGNNAHVRCARALEDPAQRRLFGPQPKLNV